MDSAVTSEGGPLRNMDTLNEASVTAWKRHKGSSKNTRATSPYTTTCMMRQLQGFLAMVTCLITSTYAHNTGLPAGRHSISSLHAWQVPSNMSTFSSHFQSVLEPCQSYACEISPKSKLPILDYIAWRRRTLLQQNSLNKAASMAASGILSTSSPFSQTKDDSQILGLFVTGRMSTLSSTSEAFERHALKMRHHRSKKEARRSLNLITDLPTTFQFKQVHSLSSKTFTKDKKAWQVALEKWVASLFGGKKVLHGKSRAHENESRIMVSSDARILNAANDLKFRPWMGGLVHPFRLFSGNINLPVTTHLTITKLVPGVLKDKAVPSTTEHVSNYLLISLLDKMVNSTFSGKESSELAYVVPTTTSDKSLDSSSTAETLSSLHHTHKNKMLLKAVPFIRASRSKMPSSIGSTAIARSLSVSPMKKVKFASTTDLKGADVDFIESKLAPSHDFIESKLSPSTSRNITDSPFKSTLTMTFPEGNASSGLIEPSSFLRVSDLAFKMQLISGVTQHWATSNVSYQSAPRSASLISQLPFMNTKHKVGLSHILGRTVDTSRLGSSLSITTDKARLILPSISEINTFKHTSKKIIAFHGPLEVTPLMVSKSAAALPSKISDGRNKSCISSNVLLLQPSNRTAAPFTLGSTEGMDKMSAYKLPNQTVITTENFMSLASSAQFAIESKSGTHVASTTEIPLPLGDETFPYFSTNFGGISDGGAVTPLPRAALLNAGLDLMNVKLNYSPVPLRTTTSPFQQHLITLQEKSPSITSLPTWPTHDTLLMAGSLSSHTDFSRFPFTDEFSKEMYVKPTTVSPSHQTIILKDYSPTSSPFTRIEHFSMKSTIEQNATAPNEENTTSNIFSPVSKNYMVDGASPILNFSSTLISRNLTIASALPNSFLVEKFTSLYQAKPELILSTEKTTSVPSTNISSSPYLVINQSVLTHMGAQSHGTPEQGNITVSLLSLTKSEFLVAVTEGKTSFPFYKLVSNGSSTSLNLNSGNLQPRVNISFRSTALKASQMTHRNTLESLSTAVVTKPLMMGTKTKTVQDSTYPVTVNTGLQPSLPRSSNNSVGAPLEIVSSLGIVLPDRPTAIEKADLSIFSTVPTTKAGRQFANVLHSITRMLQLNAVDKSFTPFSGMTASNHSAILNLPDLESGLATIRTNRSKRTLPTGYSNIFLTEPAHMRNSRCLTCTSAAPVVSGNELVHSFSTMASGSTSNTPGPANILYEWASYLNGGSGDWPIVTLSVSDIKVTPPCYKHTSEIPPRGLASAPTTDYKKMEDVLGSSAMINATERIFDSQVQLDLGREDKMPSTFLAQEIENTDSARYSDVATPHVVTASSVGSSDLLFSTKDASWTAKLHPFSMETNSSDWLTSTVFSSLPDFPKRFNVPDPLQPTGTEARNHVAITVSENVLPSAITAAVTHRGNLSTRAIANLTLVEKQTVPPIAQAISITERRADPDTRTSYVLKHDPSISPSRPLVVLPETAESNSSSVFTITATHANMQHTVLDHKHLISSMRGGETIAVAAGSFSVTKLLDSSVAENMNVPIQTACQNATCAESSYVSLLQLNVTTASKVSSRLKTSLLKTANVFSGTADKLSPPNMNITSKKGVAFIFPPKTSTMANCLNISSSVSPSLQPHTVSLQHNYTATAHNYNTTAVSKAPHWVSTSVVLLNVTSSTHLHHVKLPTFHSRVMTTTPNSSLTLASLGAQKAHTSKTKSTGTVYYRYHAASPRIHLKATRVLSNYTTLFDPLSTETESSVAALLSNTIATHSDFHNVTTYKLFLDHKRTSLPLKREGVSSSISKNLSSSSTRSVQNVTMSSWSLSAPTKHLGTRPSESLTSTVARSFTTIPISLLTSTVDHLGTKQTSSKIEARSTSIFITDPLIAESVVSSKYSFRSTKRMAPLSRFDPLFVRQLTTTLKNFTTIQSLTSKTSGWMASTTETDPTLLESLVPELNVPLFEMPTKNEPSLDELACTTLGTLPLRYRLTGIPYTEELQNKSAAAYKKLEHEVILTLNKIIFSRYGRRYLQTNVLHFLNGSVVVECEIKFRQDLPIPSSSDIIRTVVTEVYKKTSAFFNWSIDIHSLQSKNYTLKNLEPERLSVSFCTLRMGFVAASDFLQPALSSLKDEVTQALSKKFTIGLFQFVEVRNIKGDLLIQGDLYIDTQIHADVHQILQLLKHLVNQSVDLTSLSVDGVLLDLQVFPITFRVTNRKFDIQLLDHLSKEFQNLTRDLSAAVLHALGKNDNLLQVVIRDVLSGFVLCRGDLIFQKPAPASQDILQTLISKIGSDKVLAGSAFKVDPFSLTVGDSKPDPLLEYTDFPGFAVAIIVMCGLSILFIPILAMLFLKSGMLGRRSKATIQRQQDAEMGQGAVELDNRGFHSSPEQP